MITNDTGGARWFLSGATVLGLLIASAPVVSPLTTPPTPEDGVVLASWWLALAVAIWFTCSVLLWRFVLRSPSSRLAAVARRATLPGSRKIAESTLAVSLMLGAGACSIGPTNAAPTLTLVASGLPTEPTTSRTSTTTLTTATTSAVASSEPSTTAANEPSSTLEQEQAGQEPAEPTSTNQEPNIQVSSFESVYEVREGDNLWSIARQRVKANIGAEPTTSEVATYWRELVATTRDSLVSGDSNLIYPGEILVLPALK